MENYFKILGLSPDADLQEVKKAYRRLALKYHPDLQSGNEEHFKKIVEAYEMIRSHIKSRSSRREMSPEELLRFYELLKAAAEEKAKQKAFERAARVRAKKIEDQNRAYSLAVYSLIGIVVLAFFSYKSYFWIIDYEIDSNPAQTMAKVVGIENHRVVYQFVVGDEVYEERAYVKGSGIKMYAANGMPLKIGDQFVLRYRKDDPYFHDLNTYSVASHTFNRYIDLASEAILQYSYNKMEEEPNLIKKVEARCMAYLIYQKFGIEGLASCYHFDTHPFDHFKDNSLSWYFFWDKDEVREIREACRIPQA
ncbi:J domain-containing protein [Croceimicrobium hydrocarbonivorans]|uniref:J domain-containing protein n=1 Tax=Croceimicrobium hydrocarbonivorans TaxID=2761580 RepID=UPI001B35537E|nr:J domain-containing protein [Croceimicrobium hydrocarbonivorans]